MKRVKAKKSLGQHFLIDLDVAHRIAGVIDGYVGVPVVEVGPGMGVLTRFLLDAGHTLSVVELDRESVQYLGEHFKALDGKIIEADFLKLDLNDIAPQESKLVVMGNYPYNISSQILFHALDFKERVVCCAGMFQREVAQRVAAPPGNKTRGILSVLLQAWYDVEYLFTVDEHVFNPPPKVKSGVIRLTRNSVQQLGCDEKLFKTVVKTGFGQRRKTLRNSLRGLLPPGTETGNNEMWQMRPEQLSVQQFVALTNLVDEIRSKNQ